MNRHFISDLHLDSSRQAMCDLFFHYMDNIAPRSDELYVLGDLFEVWVGDDDDSAFAQTIIDKFRQYTDSGKFLYFLHGNRDFLLGEGFEKRTGGKILKDPSVITVNKIKTLLSHGDQYCTDDVDYMNFREQIRHPEWIKQFLNMPFDHRVQMAQNMREKSAEAQQQKQTEIMDVNADEIIKAFNFWKCSLMIHGHTHRPDVHKFNIGERKLIRIVLSDWSSARGHFLEVKESGYKSIWFDLKKFYRNKV